MYTHLSKIQRLELKVLLTKGYSQRNIAKALDINQSTISRELKRNSMRNTGEYHPIKAQHKAYVKRKYSKYNCMKISSDSFLRDYIINKLKEGWTPDQITGRLFIEHSRILSFKSIYSWLSSAQGELYVHYLPSKTWGNKKKKKGKAGHIPNRISIEERPKIINQRKRIGDFEGDTMGKPKHTAQTLVVAVDRKSRLLVARKVKSLGLTIEGFQSILPQSSKSFTLDNGLENVRYETLDIPTYFCHAYASWEKGTVENTIQRIRRFIPKKTNLADVSDDFIARLVRRMNNTPRKCLGYRTPAEIFKEHLHH